MPHRFWCCLHSSPPINNPIKILFQNNLGVSDARVKEQKFVISGDKNGSSVLREKKKKCKQNRIQVQINWINLPNPEFLHRIRHMLGLNTHTGLGPVQNVEIFQQRQLLLLAGDKMYTGMWIPYRYKKLPSTAESNLDPDPKHDVKKDKVPKQDGQVYSDPNQNVSSPSTSLCNQLLRSINRPIV